MKILVTEDDPTLCAQIAEALRAAGMIVDTAHDGEDGEFLGSTETYDAAVLDLGLPGLDGVEVLTRWRASGVTIPVLILTARDEWADKVRGFRAGADDYVVKPFRMDEVVLRLQTLIRRAAGHASAIVTAGDLDLDTSSGQITQAGMPVRLTAFENRLLAYLILHKGRIVSRTELSDHMYDHAADRDFRSLEVVIGRIRRKIGMDRIETRRGEGYLLPAGSEK
ncbi:MULTISPECIES: response regulator transcription factor [unclassified Yoonia]|uniref:response regulator transcription factor n=1 Tax=unclassified Yoonia TaxID=2629118 RepID=UPI002B002D43|nr:MULTISPECIES: response regulator transcription factor [unclassified Yoonia]